MIDRENDWSAIKWLLGVVVCLGLAVIAMELI